ncbi:glycosyltransferase [Mobilicoccus pelagius]|uniref:Putative glycosyltransferase n=1 Tax=Mobilicoccus pelagius NBRC 104925 TaxID=1089455 RepID=H5UMX5_9MICO|nr:glycosyltransferase [Mobilicoccus pelagius]GAB47083.1 putative glycosyltransferase [Mobilicoccus pelagius NBRC 104925]
MTSYDVSILTSGHDVADARLHREAAALVAEGLSVEVLGLGDAADGPPDTTVRTWPRAGGVRRAGLAARMAAQAGGRVLVSLDPDSALAAHTAVLASGRELVVDVHEDYAALLADRAWASSFGGLAGRAGHEVVRAFQRIAGRAALTVVADEHVPPLRARRRLVLPNDPDVSMLPEPAEPEATPRALYIGDVRTSRGLLVMLAALRAAPTWRLDVVGPVAPADQDALDALLAADTDLAARVTFHGRRPPREAWCLARGAWAGLLLLHDTPAFREALPSKVGEYLACGLPVVTTDLPRQAAVVRGSAGHGAVGVVVPVGEDEAVGAAVAEHLRAWAADPASLHAMRAPAVAASVRGGDHDDPYARFARTVVDLLTGPTDEDIDADAEIAVTDHDVRIAGDAAEETDAGATPAHDADHGTLHDVHTDVTDAADGTPGIAARISGVFDRFRRPGGGR